MRWWRIWRWSERKRAADAAHLPPSSRPSEAQSRDPLDERSFTCSAIQAAFRNQHLPTDFMIFQWFPHLRCAACGMTALDNFANPTKNRRTTQRGSPFPLFDRYLLIHIQRMHSKFCLKLRAIPSVQPTFHHQSRCDGKSGIGIRP
jgi:hypothetical protein